MHDIFAFTDIHGMYGLYKGIIDYCMKEDPECTIIFCGDACDRGPDGYKIMKELLDNPQVIYLKGNHEDMFVRAVYEIKKYFNFDQPECKEVQKILKSCLVFDGKYTNIQDSLYNGGLPTLTDWIMDGEPMNIVDKLEHLPLTFSTDTCDFCHSAGVYQVFKRVADCEYENKDPDQYDADAIIWGRTAIGWGWAPNRTAIFGHTPTVSLPVYARVEKEEGRPVKFIRRPVLDDSMTGAKIDMDTGACFLGTAYVLNCLTMKAQGFEMKNGEAKKIEVIQF